MLIHEDFTPEKLRIHWSAILSIFAVQLILWIVLAIVVANHSNGIIAGH